MKTQGKLDDENLRRTLKTQLRGCGSEWNILFDSSERLIDGTIDELTAEPKHPHPLKNFYEDYTKRIWGVGHTVYTPYDASIPVLPISGVTGRFGKPARKIGCRSLSLRVPERSIDLPPPLKPSAS